MVGRQVTAPPARDSCGEPHITPARTLSTAIQMYYMPRLNVERENPQTYIYSQSFKAHLIFLGLASISVLLNLLSESVFKCSDPMIRSTIAIYAVPVKPAFQWIQVILSATSLALVNFIIELLRRDDPESRAQCVYRCLLELTTDSSTSALVGSISEWRVNAGAKRSKLKQWRAGALRRTFFYLFHVPILVAASIPSIGFVYTFYAKCREWLML